MARVRVSGQFSLTRLSLCLGLAFGGGVWAQQAPEMSAPVERPVVMLKEVVISGSRVEQDIDGVPATMTTINADEIAKQNSTDLEDLLKNEVGVSVRALPLRPSMGGNIGRGGNEGVNIRGLEGDQVRMQIDGVSLPSTYNSGPFYSARGEFLDVEGYKRVEIMRGAASTQYGSDGLAGVVSFVTKDPADLLTLGNPTQFNLKSSYSSSDQSWQLAPNFAFKGEKVQGMVLASTRRGHETSNMGSNDVDGANRTTPNPTDASSDYVLAKFVLDADRSHQFKLTAETIRRETAVDSYSTRSATVRDFDARDEMNRDLFKLDYRYVPSRTWFDVLTASVYTQESRNRQFHWERTATNLRSRDTQYGENTLGGSVQMETNLGSDITHRLVYGVEAKLTDINSFKDGSNGSLAAFPKGKSFPDTDYRTFAVFAQDEIGVGSLSITPGIRFDSFKLTPKPDAWYRAQNSVEPSELSDAGLSPKLGAVWKLDPLAQPFAQYARGFRAPLASQVNGGVTNLGGAAPYKSIGNSDLKSETSDTVELGLRGRNATLRYSAAAFYGEYKNFIESNARVYTSPAPSAIDPNVNQSINLGKVIISGFELRGDWAFAPNWGVSAAYARTKGDSENNGVAAPLASIDPDKLVLGLRYDRGARWGLASTLTAVGRKDREHIDTAYVPGGYTVVDLSGWYSFSKATNLNFSINNLFDRKYVEWADVRDLAASSTIVDAYTQPGRNFKVSLTHSF